MKIYESAVRKPVSTIMIFIAVLVMGVFSLRNLAIDMFPEMDMPMLMVMTSYPGANATNRNEHNPCDGGSTQHGQQS